MKEILLELVDELANLRASLVVLSQRAVTEPMSALDAQDALRLASRDIAKSYDSLRRKIEAL